MLDPIGCCSSWRPKYQPADFIVQLQLSQALIAKLVAEADTECIAHSGVIPDPVFIHDPSPPLQSFIQRHGKLPGKERQFGASLFMLQGMLEKLKSEPNSECQLES